MIRTTVEAGIEPNGTLYEVVEVVDPKGPFLFSRRFYLSWPPDNRISRMNEIPADNAEEDFGMAGTGAR